MALANCKKYAVYVRRANIENEGVSDWSRKNKKTLDLLIALSVAP